MQWIFWVIAFCLSAGAGYWVYQADKKREVPYPLLTAVLRSLLILLACLLVLLPALMISRNIVEQPIVVMLQDDSKSVGVALGKDSTTYMHHFDDLVSGLNKTCKVVQWHFGGTVLTDSSTGYRQGATDIANALSQVQEYYGTQNLGAVVLATDGRFNQGMNPLLQQAGLKAPLFAIAIGDSQQQKDAKLPTAHANRTVSLNSNFEVVADVVLVGCKGYNGSLTLKEAGAILGTQSLNVNSDRYDRTLSFTIKADKPGIHHYELNLPVAEGEKNTANNRKEIFVEVVEEKKEVLIVAAAPHPDVAAIREALAGMESYHITVCTSDKLQNYLAKCQIIILAGFNTTNTALVNTILQAHKPIWFILGNQTNVQSVNALKDLTHLSVSPAALHNVLSLLNPAFNVFTMPSHLQTVVDKLPPLSSNVDNLLTAPGTMSLFEQRTGAGDSRTPVWLLQQGDVPMAYLTGEGLWRWRMHEYRNFGVHDAIDECIRQTVTFLASHPGDKPFSVSLSKYVWSDQEAIQLQALLLNPNREQINTPDVILTINDSAGKHTEYNMERSGSSYRLNIGVRAGGMYTYTASTKFSGIPYSASGSFAVQTVPIELMESGADYALLYSLARKYQGAFFTPANMQSAADSILHNSHVKPLIRTEHQSVPLIDRKWFFFLLLILAVTEWLLRKYWMAQ